MSSVDGSPLEFSTEQAGNPAEAAPRRGWALVALKWAGIALGSLALLLAAVFFGLNSAPGKRFIADRIAALEFESGLEISIGRIQGSIYGEMVLRDVALSDTKGVFATSPEIVVDWHPFAYLRNQVDIQSLTSELVTLQRRPKFADTPASDEPLLPDLDIDIDRLRIDRFVVAPPVTGERRVLTIGGEVHIADRRAQVKLAARTLSGGGVAGGDRLALTMDVVPEANRLVLDTSLDAPGDGVFAALTGLNAPTRLRLAGRGDWANWNGRLLADLSGEEFARLSLAANNGTVRVTGPTRVAQLFDGQTAQLLGPVLVVDLTGSLEERRIDLAGNFASDAMRVQANGLVDLSNNTFDDLRLGVVVLRPSALAENLTGSGLRGQFVLNGDFATPRVRYALNANRLLAGDTGFQNLRASGAAEIRVDQIFIPVTARIDRVTGLDTVAGGTLANVRVNGDLAIDGPRILSDNLRIRSDRIDAGLILVADTSTGLYTGAIDGRIDDYRLASVGIFNLDTDVDLRRTSGGGFALVGRVQARSTRLFNDAVRDFLGGNAVGAANVRYGPDGIIRFSNLTVRAPDVRITGGDGFYAPDGRLALNAQGVTDAYGRVGVRVAGTLSNPNAAVTAERPNLGIGLANLRATITRAGAGYRLNATGDTEYGLLSARVVLGTGPQTSIQIEQANLAGIDFTGSLRRTAAGPFTGRLDANGRGLAGVVRLSAAGRFQEALVNLRARDTVLDGPTRLAIGSGIVDARVILYDRPYVVADVQLYDSRYNDLVLTAMRAKVDYRDGSGNARILAEGSRGVPFRVAANAQLLPDLWRVALQGRARGIAFRTASPARIVPRNGRYELLPTRIAFDNGAMRLAGTYGEGLKVQSRLENLDLAIVNAFVSDLGLAGRATGSLDFEQPNPSAFPRADARLTINGFRRSTAAVVSQPVDITFVGKLLPDGGEARAVMRRRGAVIGRMLASLRPLGPGSGSWTTRLLAAPLGGGIRYNGPADTLFSFAGLANQQVTGPIGLAADFTGRVSNPVLNGIVRANNLTYQNLTYGTRLTNLALAGRFSGNRLQIDQASARAGDGRASAQGFISLSAAGGFPMNIAVELDNARIARGEPLATTATGSFRLTKTAGETALVTGNLALPNTRYQLRRQGAAEVPVLTGVRFKPPRGPLRITGDEQPESAASLFDLVRLDIGLRARERLYVSGMGLESEWDADLRLLGTSANPRFTGEANLIRGTLGFAGRSFELTRGRVTFLGGETINPTINLVASEDIEDVTVNVNVTGRAYNPQIAFTSVPGLPQDEIVARVLFGSSVGDLSAIQAVQLAASLNSLRGSGGGLNPLGALRSAVGIDRLRILSADDRAGRGTALAAGEYLTDDIYLEFITDARGFTATQLEVSLTPALSILSQVGGSGGTNVNVQYRKNY
jgi:translocation and assembly module TamB